MSQMIVCNKASNSQKLYKILQVIKDKTRNGLYDTMHLINVFRNNLISGKFLYKGIYIFHRHQRCS